MNELFKGLEIATPTLDVMIHRWNREVSFVMRFCLFDFAELYK